MEQNYLWGEKGIQIDAMMEATAWNLKKMMEKLGGRVFIYSQMHFSNQTFNVSPLECEFLRSDYLEQLVKIFFQDNGFQGIEQEKQHLFFLLQIN